MIKRSETSHPQDAMAVCTRGGRGWGLPDHPGDEYGDRLRPGTSRRAL